MGSAGLFTGAMTAVAQVAPMEKRPLIIGLVGGLFGISAVIGPLVCGFLLGGSDFWEKRTDDGGQLGGALTDRTTWRWCFYLNCKWYQISLKSLMTERTVVPIGAVAVIGILIFLHVDQELEKAAGGIMDQIMSFDPIGNALFVSAVICLLLALQWGGTTYDWSSGRIIALFVLFGVLFVAFVAVQFWLGEGATGMLRPHHEVCL